MAEFLTSAGGPPAEGDVSRGSDFIVTSAVFTSAALTVVALRLFTRVKLVGRVGVDDYLMIAAMIVSILGLALAVVDVHHGAGRHFYYVPQKDASAIVMINHLLEFQNITNTLLIKLSACCFILRILLGANNKIIKRCIFVLMGWMTVISLLTIFMILFECIPVEAAWDPTIKGTCSNGKRELIVGYVLGVTSIITDFACSLFPILIFSRLQINHRTKIALCGVMCLGLIASVCCVVKTAKLKDLLSPDGTYQLIPVDIWALVEVNVGIVACSIPALQPLFKAYFHAQPHKHPDPKPRLASHPLSSFQNSNPFRRLLSAAFFHSRSTLFRSSKSKNSARDANKELPSHCPSESTGSTRSDDRILPIMKTTDIVLEKDTLGPWDKNSEEWEARRQEGFSAV